MDFTRLKFYRRLLKCLGRPLKAEQKLNFPEGYYVFLDLVEGRMVVKLMRDYGWKSEVIQVFDSRVPISIIRESAEIHRLGELN
jgi:hypothetical protein